jgi:hypothetical protein
MIATFCPTLDICMKEQNEVLRYDCINSHLFHHIHNNNDPIHQKYIAYDCGGVGWGNSIRAYYTGVSLALTLGRRLILHYPAFNRNFLPPNETVSQWAFDSEYHLFSAETETFNYAEHGQEPGSYAKWSNGIRTNDTSSLYEKKILSTGLCGGDSGFLKTGGCLDKLLPIFTHCSHEDQVSMNIPFFYYLMRRPGPFIINTLQSIRIRIGLPPAGPDDHHIGLRSEGYYILALHFRRIPIGFEPLALELNQGRQLEFRMAALEGFWDHAQKAANRAIDIAACRKQELLIYFASDDVDLRSEAVSKLSSISRVVFCLHHDKIGHVSPGWRNTDFNNVEGDIVAGTGASVIKSRMSMSRDNTDFLGDMAVSTMTITSALYDECVSAIDGGMVDSGAFTLALEWRVYFLLHYSWRYRLRSHWCYGKA